MIFGVVAARAARLFFRIEPIISWFLALSLHTQHDNFFRIEPIISLIFGVVVARAARLLFFLQPIKSLTYVVVVILS